jgi:hypothetical protein
MDRYLRSSPKSLVSANGWLFNLIGTLPASTRRL